MLLLELPDLRVLTVSVNDHRTAIAALRAGAVGHIAKDTDPDGLAELVVRAADGEVIVSQRLMPALLDALREVPDSGWRPLRSRLTTREWEIVELLGRIGPAPRDAGPSSEPDVRLSPHPAQATSAESGNPKAYDPSIERSGRPQVHSPRPLVAASSLSIGWVSSLSSVGGVT